MYRTVGRLAPALGTLATLALVGCAAEPGPVDGDLTGDWSEVAEPVQMVPEAGVCHNSDHRPRVKLGIYYKPRECTRPHRIETVYVGEFEGPAAERTGPPRLGGEFWRETYRECDDRAADYLGADFRHGSLWLGVSVPIAAAWEGGARWFRCDVTDLGAHYLPTVWQDTRRGALADRSSPLALGCFTVTLDDQDRVDTMDPVECDEPHQAEFVGVWHSDQSRYPETERAEAQVHRSCLDRVAEFVDVPKDGDLEYRSGTIYDGIWDEDWDNGDRGFRCYLWRGGEDLTESLAGAGPSGLPVR